MAIRFIRQPSDTPNVTNSDDARMVRYAYGGYDGFVLNRGSELSHTINGNIFKINSGVVVLQGYESELDSNGWELDVGSTSRYYSVYYEVNLATQTAAIKSVYNLSSYPDIPASDDLTQSANGIAYLLLYQFRVVNNAITDVVKKVKAVQYSQTQFSETNNLLGDLDTNLNDLKQGLRNGEVTPLQCTKISPPDWTELITGTAKGSVTLPDDGLFEILIQNSFNTSHPEDKGLMWNFIIRSGSNKEFQSPIMRLGYNGTDYCCMVRNRVLEMKDKNNSGITMHSVQVRKISD